MLRILNQPKKLIKKKTKKKKKITIVIHRKNYWTIRVMGEDDQPNVIYCENMDFFYTSFIHQPKRHRIKSQLDTF